MTGTFSTGPLRPAIANRPNAWLTPVAQRLITLRFDHSLTIVSESLHIRTRPDWLGHQPFFGAEVPSPDAVAARTLQDQWRQCSQCADAWEVESNDEFSRCPGCGAITQLEGAAKPSEQKQ